MKTSFEAQAKESYEQGNYEDYVKYANKQYEQTKSQDDLEELQKAEKYLNLFKEIQEIIKMENKSSYDILGISQKSSINEIKRAFREKASRYHPDRAPVKGAHDAFRIIQMAYFNINTEEKKAEYDTKSTRKQTFYSHRSNDLYNMPRTEHLFTSENGSFVFSASFNSSTWPFEIYYQDLANIYSSFYRNRTMSSNRTIDQGHGFRFLIVVFVFILLNLIV